MSNPLFTAEELEELKRIDAELDSQPVTKEEYEALDFIEELLFPEKFAEKKEKVRARRRAHYEKHREEHLKACREYYASHKEEIAARKARWYQENKERLRIQQREYRIRVGQIRTPEQKEADKLARAESRKARLKAEREARSDEYLEKLENQRQYQLAYRAKKKGMTVQEYTAYQEAKKKAVEAATADAHDEAGRKRAYQKAYREAHREEYLEYQKAYHQSRKASRQQEQTTAAIA